MGERRSRFGSWIARVGTIAVVAAAAGAVQFTAAAPASAAVTGLVRTTGISVIDSSASKTATAYCPPGTRVVGGGGGLVWDLQHQTRQVVLTQLQPVHPLWGDDFYRVTGEETQTGTTDTWWVEAVALCADPIPGMHITFGNTVLSSASSQQARATCPAGEKVLGTGAWVYPAGGQVGLQVARASTSGNLAYAIAHEDADGYAGNWNVLALAVCAPAPAGYEVLNAPSPESASESIKTATATCSAGKQMLDAGGATSFTAPGNVSLTRILVAPFGALNWAEAIATENTATAANWDFIVAQVICAT